MMSDQKKENTPRKKKPGCLPLVLVFFGILIGGVVTFFGLNTVEKLVLDSQISPEDHIPENIDISEDIPAIVVSPIAPLVSKKITDMRELSKGFQYTSVLNFEPGQTAATERELAESYHAHYTLSIREPSPARSLADLTAPAPLLGKQLPALETLLSTATVSPHWGKLYRSKNGRTTNNAHHLLKLLTKHNYYDCNTILNLRDAETGRKAFLVQADMDVVADGSDGDRLPTMPDEIVNSTHYQPTTSYSWQKATTTPNPLIAGYLTRIENANTELKDPTTKKERKNWLNQRKKQLKATIDELKSRSYLIAEYDPFIVLPVPVIVNKSDPYAPNVGDYCLVFYKDRIFPAIVGDAGPDYKMGEASLRLAKELNPKASPYFRPVSDLSVTYLVFPGSRKRPHRAPDYDEIRSECLSLVSELGGLGDPDSLHSWSNLLPDLAQPSEENADAPSEEATQDN